MFTESLLAVIANWAQFSVNRLKARKLCGNLPGVPEKILYMDEDPYRTTVT